MSTEGERIHAIPRSDAGEAANAHGLSRRNLLLSGTTLAAASALGSAAAMRSAQTHAAGAAGTKPNILMIMADDIGGSTSASTTTA